MFDKFGEMNSADELNELAVNFLKEGDNDSLKVMAEENGIPAEYAEMFIEGEIPFLADPITAANGKLDLESKELGLKGLMSDWVEYIRGLCVENEKMAAAVRKKGKSLKECIAKILKYSFANQWPVPDEIKKAAAVKAGRVTFGVPSMGEAKKLIKDYYLAGGGK